VLAELAEREVLGKRHGRFFPRCWTDVLSTDGASFRPNLAAHLPVHRPIGTKVLANHPGRRRLDLPRVADRPQRIGELQQERLALLPVPQQRLRSLEVGHLFLGVDAARDIEPGHEVVEGAPMLVLEGADEHGRDEAGAVLAILDRLDDVVLVRPDCFAEARGVVRIGAAPIHEVRLLTQHLPHAVAGKLQEGFVGENDRVAGKVGVRQGHRHPGGAHGLDEHAAALPQFFDPRLGVGPSVRPGLSSLEIVRRVAVKRWRRDVALHGRDGGSWD
jgi:hypothetical protein